MSEGDAILQDIRANPDDDGLRLIYADWLEDNEQAERAEFIRVQMRLLNAKSCSRFMHDCGEFCDLKQLAEIGCEECCRPYAKDKLREESLLESHAYYWVNTPQVWPVSMTLGGKNTVTFRRGFVAEWKMRMQDWLDHGKAVLTAHPIERVEITDRRPRARTASGEKVGHGWFNGGLGRREKEDLDERLWKLLEGGRFYGWWKYYASEAETIDALSRACLAYAEQLTQSPTVEV